jgi:uncharacterized protein YciI
MTKNIFFILPFLFLFACTTQSDKNTKKHENQSVTKFDEGLAKSTGADQFGMKPYVMAFLKAGPNRDQDSITAEKLQRAHLDNIFRLADEGKLLVAGPFTDNTELKGIYIFNVKSLEEAKKLTASDPAIKAGRLIMELHPWYGPAGLMLLDSIQGKISKEKI